MERRGTNKSRKQISILKEQNTPKKIAKPPRVNHRDKYGNTHLGSCYHAGTAKDADVLGVVICRCLPTLCSHAENHPKPQNQREPTVQV
nr:hypothetical protein Itr_chr13CG13200 [Ipomoea trifida]